MQRRAVSLLAATSLIVLGLGVFAEVPTAQALTTVTPSTTAASMSAATSAYLSYAATRTVATGWTGNTSSCVAGQPSAAHQTATFAAINYFRKMAGLGAVSENSALSAQAQQAALMQAANNSLSHTPPTTWKCYTTAGATSSGQSNLALGYPNGPTAVSGWINDSDSSNSPMVGHRQWILDPLLSTFGSGTAGSGGALQWGGAATSSSNPNPAIIAWPSAGYFPYEITFDKPGAYYTSTPLTAWSVQSTSASFASATVTVTLNGASVSHGAVTTTSGYGGSRALIWQMPTIPQPALGTVNDYKVTISGISGLTDSTYTYDVRVYNATAVMIGSATISGTAQFGQTLTAATSGLSPSATKLTYQWYRGGTAISGATGSTYTTVAADVNTALTVKVTGNYTDSASGVVFAPASLTSPSVTVNPAPMTANLTTPTSAQVGVSITANTASWVPSGTSFTYQWLSNGAVISGATGPTYTPAAADVGKTLTVTVTGKKTGYYTTVVQRAIGTVQPGKMTASVGLSAVAQVGTKITATTSWSPTGTALTYQWLSGTTVISGATGASYTPVASDIGKTITVKVTGTKAGYTTLIAQATSGKVLGLLTVGTPTISGTVAVGYTLTANPGKWGPSGVTLKYQWYRNGTAISGASHATYVLTAADDGQAITVTVAGSLSGYVSATNTSASVSTVQKIPMYRLFNTVTGEHFYTASAYERDGLIKSGIWNYEGIGWTAPSTSSAPVFRFFNTVTGDHFYTMSTVERDSLASGGIWRYEGIGWYSETVPALQVPVYRAWNPSASVGSHNYTSSASEQGGLIKNLGWRDEGIGWYGIK